MKCKRCKKILFIDHEEDGVLVFKCVNKKCSNYNEPVTKRGDDSVQG